MKLVPYDAKKVGYFKKTKNFELLDEFAKSDYDCCMVTDYTHKDANSCQSALRHSAKIFHMDNIHVFIRKGQVFLAKKSAFK